MANERKDMKARAKFSMSRTTPSVYLVTAAYMIVSFFLSSLTIKLTGTESYYQSIYTAFSSLQEYPQSVQDLESILQMLPMRVAPSAYAVVLATLVELIAGVLGNGFTLYSLRVSRGAKAGFESFTDVFALFFKLIWLQILIGLLLLPISIGFFCLSIFISLIASSFSSEAFLIALTSITTFAFVILIVVYAMKYRMAVYFMLDYPQMSAWECIESSKKLMEGRRWNLFVMDLSFLGWQLLSGLFLTLPNIYVMPYMEVSYSNFYNYALSGYVPYGGEESSGVRPPWASQNGAPGGQPPLPFGAAPPDDSAPTWGGQFPPAPDRDGGEQDSPPDAPPPGDGDSEKQP